MVRHHAARHRRDGEAAGGGGHWTSARLRPLDQRRGLVDPAVEERHHLQPGGDSSP